MLPVVCLCCVFSHRQPRLRQFTKHRNDCSTLAASTMPAQCKYLTVQHTWSPANVCKRSLSNQIVRADGSCSNRGTKLQLMRLTLLVRFNTACNILQLQPIAPVPRLAAKHTHSHAHWQLVLLTKKYQLLLASCRDQFHPYQEQPWCLGVGP